MAIVSVLTRVAMNSIFILLFCIPPMALSLTFVKIQLPPGVTGPASIAFDSLGKGFYTSVQDGRILKYQAATSNFLDFAFTTATRSKAVCDGQTNEDLETTCGRPLSLDLNRATNQLFIADAYFGLLVAGTNGRLATQLTGSVNGVPYRFINGLGLHPLTGDVYFTDFSTVFQLRNLPLAVDSGDATGRLLKYDINTKQVTVLLSGLSGAAGTAVSADGAFVLVSELIGGRIQRFWLKGPKNNTAETIITFQGRPNKIRRTEVGDFWVAVNVLKPPSADTVPTRIRVSQYGKIVETVALDREYNTTRISEVQQFLGANYYIASRDTDFVGVYKIF